MKLSEKWESDDMFTKMILKLKKPHTEFIDKDDNVHSVLSKFDNIALLWKDKTITETHVQWFFGKNIVRITANKSVMKILDKYHNEDVKNNYNHLKKLLKESKSWKISPYPSE